MICSHEQPAVSAVVKVRRGLLPCLAAGRGSERSAAARARRLACPRNGLYCTKEMRPWERATFPGPGSSP